MKDKEKQIYELTADICYACKGRHLCFNKNCTMAKIVAEELINAGYRKVGGSEKTVCPVCGKEMDETEHGRQYCADCKEKLK